MTRPNVPKSPLIRRLCKLIEKEDRIKILFAVENGSRAWRMESEDSDYDVRFVFHYPWRSISHSPGQRMCWSDTMTRAEDRIQQQDARSTLSVLTSSST